MKKLGPEMQITSQFMQFTEVHRWKEDSTLFTSDLMKPTSSPALREVYCVMLFGCVFILTWLGEPAVEDRGSVRSCLHCLGVHSASDSAQDLSFWKLETFWKALHWLASKHEHRKANSILEYEVMVYMTSSSSVKNAGNSHPWGHIHRSFLFCQGLLIKYF